MRRRDVRNDQAIDVQHISGDVRRQRRSERGHVGSSQSDVGRAGRVCNGTCVDGHALRDHAG